MALIFRKRMKKSSEIIGKAGEEARLIGFHIAAHGANIEDEFSRFDVFSHIFLRHYVSINSPKAVGLFIN